jgi:hypothetical protein
LNNEWKVLDLRGGGLWNKRENNMPPSAPAILKILLLSVETDSFGALNFILTNTPCHEKCQKERAYEDCKKRVDILIRN